MSYVVEIAPYDPIWPASFAQLGRELRAGLGTTALRIGHIGIFLCVEPVVRRNSSRSYSETINAHTQKRRGAMRPSNISWPTSTERIATAIRMRKARSSGRS
jgi:GrpB-like predicted nucleotidyltransferase (UPF0157 family)